MDLQNQT